MLQILGMRISSEYLKFRLFSEDNKFAVMVTDSGLYEVNTNTEALLKQLPIRITPAVDRTCLCVCLFVYLFVCLFVCLFVS